MFSGSIDARISLLVEISVVEVFGTIWLLIDLKYT